MKKARGAARCAALPRSIHTLSFRASDQCHWRGNPFPAPAGAESLAFLCEAAQCSPRSKYPWGAHWVVRRSVAEVSRPKAVTEGLFFRAGGCGHPPLRKTAVLPLHPRKNKEQEGRRDAPPFLLFFGGGVWEMITRWYSYRNSPGCRRWACPCRRCRWSGRTANRSGR